jgi:protein-S-isoprenylcysteine O-methyltransferase Ste14
MERLLPPRLVVVLLVVSVAGGAWLPGPGPLPALIRIGGAPVAVLGIVLTVAAARVFERVGTNIVTTRDPDLLVTTGPFALTRNPMYLGFLVFLAGVALGVGTLWAAVGPVVFLVVADRWYIPFEERRGSAVFGAAFDRYRATVRRWIGRRSVAATR